MDLSFLRILVMLVYITKPYRITFFNFNNKIYRKFFRFLFMRESKIYSSWFANSFSRVVILVFTLNILWSNVVFSQSCANYAPVMRDTGITYSSIINSNPSFFTWRNTTSNQNDDNRSYPVPIGFDFWYLGVRYTHFSANLNGIIDFSSSTSDGNNGGTGPYGPNYNNLFSTANQTMLAIAPLYADLWTPNSGQSPISNHLVYQISGSAPYRVLTVEWNNFDEWNTPVNNPPASINMQLKLYETTGVIEFIYGTMVAGASGGGSYPLRYTCGINSTWASGSPTVEQLLTQQTVNSTTFNNTPQNSLSTLPTSNSKLTFTPPNPTAAPTNLTFTSVTKTGMILNWTDNATNEVGYVIYNSTDDVNFNFVTQVAANSTSAPIINLSSSTTYYWKVYAVTEGALSSPLTGSQATLPAEKITSITDGNWSATSTWDCGCTPSPGDTVVIADGNTVTLDVNTACKSLIVGQGISGQLVIGNDATGRTFSIYNDVIINSGGTLTTGTTSATHTMNVGGNIINNGTLNLAPTGTRVCNVTFNKNGNQTISGSGNKTNFNRISLNMGNSRSNILEVISNNFSAASNFLTLLNGTFKLSTGVTVTPFTGNVSIPASSGIWINHSSASMSTTGGTITLYGLLRASAGTLNIGNAVNNNLHSYGGTIIIEGGSVNIAGRLDRAGPTVLTNFTISSGTLTLCTVGSTTAGAPPFRIDEPGSTFNMSGGKIVIQNSGAGNLGYMNTGGTIGTVSGGILQIGNTSTPVGQTIQINSSIAIPNLVIGEGVNVTAQLATNSLSVINNILINSGILDANNLNITLGGIWVNNGIFTSGGGTVTFNGASVQSIGGSSQTPFNNLTINNANGVTLGNTTTVNGTLTFNSGVITSGPNLLIVGPTGNVTRTNGHVWGNFQKYISTGSASIIFEIGDSLTYSPVSLQFGNVSNAGNLTAKVITGDHPEIKSSAIEQTKSVNRYWSLNNNGTIYDSCNAIFNFVPADLDVNTDTASLIVQQYDSTTWSTPEVGVRTSTSVEVKGLTNFGDFATGNIKTYTIVATSDSNGQISPSGSVIVNYKSNQTFIITPNTGYHFDSLFVDGVHVDSTASYTFNNVTANHTIHAKFAINKYTITATAGTGGSIAPSGTVTVDHGSDAVFTITPNTGYHFDSLFVDGVHVDSTASYTFNNVTANHTIHAKFAINKYTITATAGTGGSITPSGAVTVDHGSDAVFTITPNTGYHTDSLFVDGVHVDSTTSYTFINVTGPHTIHAKFAVNVYVITSDKVGNGTITPSGIVNVVYGEDRTFYISPDAGHHLDSLFVDGVHVDSTVSYTFYNVTSNHIILAKFAVDVFEITASAGVGGTITPSGIIKVNYGGSQNFVITPNTGYHFDSLFVDGVHVDSTASYTFNNVTANHTIHAKFAINKYTITATASIGGTINPSGAVLINYGANQTFIITPNSGYAIDSLIVDGSKVDSTVSYTFYNVSGNHTISVKFVRLQFSITSSAGAGGTITPSGTVFVEYGGSQRYIITPNIGYNIDTVFVDGVYVDSTVSYTFSNVTQNHTIYVKFRIRTFTITATAGPNGSITPSGTIQVSYGDSISFAMQPDDNYIVDSIFVDGIYAGKDSIYTFRNISADHTIHVQFTFTVSAEDVGDIPKDYAMYQNYPNPFNPITKINYDLPYESRVIIKVYNMIGQLITTLKDEVESAGCHDLYFNAAGLTSGVYFYRIEASSTANSDVNYTQLKKMILLK